MDQAIVEVPNAGWDERVRMFRAREEVDCFVVLSTSHLSLG